MAEHDDKPRRTVAWLVKWFLANDREGRSEDARTERCRVLGLFLAFKNRDAQTIGELYVDQLTGADLLEFINGHKPTLAQWTRRRWANTVKRPLREATKLGLITHSPLDRPAARRGHRNRHRCVLPASGEARSLSLPRGPGPNLRN